MEFSEWREWRRKPGPDYPHSDEGWRRWWEDRGQHRGVTRTYEGMARTVPE